MKKTISAFILVIFILQIFSSVAIQVSAAVPPTSNIIPNGIYYIRNQRSGLYLDVYNNGTTDNTVVQQYYYNGGDNQRFQIKIVSVGVYEIIPLHAVGMRLDVYNAGTNNDDPVHIYTSNSTVAQKFKIVPTGNGDNSFKILTATSDYTKCITAQHASMSPSNIIQYSYGNNGNEDNDHWYFEDVTLNEKTIVTLSAGETKSFEITIPDNMYYSIETTQYGISTVDTYLTVNNLSTGNVYNDDGGVGLYSFIGFNNQGGRNLTISVRLYNSSSAGSFYLQIRKQKAVYYGFEYDDISTIEDLNTPYDAFSNLYNSFKYENKNASHFSEIDERGYNRYNSEIVFFSGHGYKNSETTEFGFGISFNNDTSFYLSNIGNMNNVRVAVWSACYSSNTNNSDSTSFVDRSVSTGAKSAIGFPDTVTTTSSISFTNDLFIKLSEGYTVGDAAEYAAKQIIWPWDNVKDYRIAGSSSTTLTTPNYTKSLAMPSQNNIESNYYSLINNDYTSFDNGNTTRYYLTINGVLTNQFVDVANKDYPQAFVAQNYTVDDEITVLPILVKYDTISTSTEEKHLVYIVENNIATPVLISYVTITEDNGATYSEAICRNLNSGKYIDYSMINRVKEICHANNN
ncbi:MAG: hypothetical protein E7670_00070 [Ruminococcaceae bacterium]|nr:hypothetical protein [Oscillospiraceae bacterium]